MSVKAAEYLKRTCLICGCHTNQTINIYEPRSGPNIVHLIQAKFKFQPLNDDKYLCFSCNNWLINWHSLQALNSNEPESPSGTFRSHMNMVMQEKPDDQAIANKSPGSQLVAEVRPIARVSPRIAENSSTTTTTTESDSSTSDSLISSRIATTQETSTTAQQTTETTRLPNEPLFRLCRKLARNVSTFRTICRICKRKIIYLTQKKSIKIVKICKNCRKAQQTQANVQILPKTQNKLVQNDTTTTTLIHMTTETSKKAQQIKATHIEEKNSNNYNLYRNQRWQPILDGKVVSKLRRLGTSLARDSADGKRSILSEATKKPQWERQLDDDEILLDFNTTISEVLPIEQRNELKQQQQSTVDLTEEEEEEEIDDDEEEEEEVEETSTMTSKTYQISVSALKKLGEQKVVMPEFDHPLPKGLTISLVSY